MATNGNIEFKYILPVADDYVRLRLRWERTDYNYDKNYSTIKWVYELYFPTATTLRTDYILNINGVRYERTNVRITPVFGWNTIEEGTQTIYHNIDGTKTFSYSFEETYDAMKPHASGTGTLDALLGQKATITYAPYFSDEQNPTINYTNPQGNNVESLQACIALYDSKSGEWHATGAPYREISKTGSSYTFNLTNAERKALRKAVTWGSTVNVRFYVRTTLKGQYLFSNMARNMGLVNHAPTISPVIKDTGSVSIGLTNDPTKVIKYFNVMSVDMRAAAQKEAILTSQAVTCGDKVLSSEGTASLTGSLSYVESGDFKCEVRDNRGIWTTQTVSLDLIEYFKPTCAFELQAPTTTGNMTFTASGSFFNDYFGDAGVAKHNTLSIKYRHKIEDGAFGAWVTVPAANISIDGNDYEFTQTISGVDYIKAHTIELIVDDSTTRFAVTRSKKVRSTPVYDWSKEDFNFNVDVNFSDEAHFNNVANFNKSIKTAHNTIIYGKNTNGEDVIAMKTCNTNNNLILGYGNWEKGLGGTNIYGNNVNIMTKNDFKINNEKSLLGLYNAMTSSYGFATATGGMSVTAGPNYSSITNANVILVGNQMRLMLTANRNSAVNGDIANEKVATITIHHGEKIAAFFNTSFGNGGAGGVASFYTTSATMPTADTLQFDIMLAAATPTSSQFSIIATLPIAINPEYYV